MIVEFIKNCGFDKSSTIVKIGMEEEPGVFYDITKNSIVYHLESIENLDYFCKYHKIFDINLVWIENKSSKDLLFLKKQNILNRTEYIAINQSENVEDKIEDINLFTSKAWDIKINLGSSILLENARYRNKLIDKSGFWKDKNINEHVFDQKLSRALLNYLKYMGVKNCVDFGCGPGQYVEYFNKEGIVTEGYDGNPYTPKLTDGKCSILNLSVDFDLNKKFDCVLSLEVGEHIPKKYENIFINNIVKHSTNLIILSWAVPNQGGHGHVNCQTNEYIKELLHNYGFKNEFYMENIIRLCATTDWFKNTVMIFKKNS